MPGLDIDHVVGALRAVRGEWRDAQKRSREPGGREFPSAGRQGVGLQASLIQPFLMDATALY